MITSTYVTRAPSYDSTYLNVDGMITAGGLSLPQPVIVPTPPPTIDQLCTAALSRLHYAIAANTEYELKQFRNYCRVRDAWIRRELFNDWTYFNEM